MPEDDYDLAGYCTGIVDKKKMLDKNTVREGDAVIALASSGVHSNGFSLVGGCLRLKMADLTLPLRNSAAEQLGRYAFGAYKNLR